MCGFSISFWNFEFEILKALIIWKYDNIIIKTNERGKGCGGQVGKMSVLCVGETLRLSSQRDSIVECGVNKFLQLITSYSSYSR